MSSWLAFSRLGIGVEKQREWEKIQDEADDKSLFASIGQTLGSLAVMGLTGGIVNPITLGLAASAGSYIGGKMGAAQKKIGKGYKWLQDEADDLRDEIGTAITTNALSTGLKSAMFQAGNLAFKGEGWGSLTEGWDKTPIGKWQANRARITGLAAESGIAPQDINWDIIGGDYSGIEAGNIAATEKLAAERLALSKEFAGETFSEGTGLEGLPAGADYETSKRFYDAYNEPMQFRGEGGEVTGSIRG